MKMYKTDTIKGKAIATILSDDVTSMPEDRRVIVLREHAIMNGWQRIERAVTLTYLPDDAKRIISAMRSSR